MKILFGILAVIFIVALIFTYPVFFIGLGITIWGIYKLQNNKRLKKKSRKPITFLIIGLIIVISGLAGQSNDESEQADSNQQTEIVDDSEENDTEVLEDKEEAQLEEEKSGNETMEDANPEEEKPSTITQSTTDANEGESAPLEAAQNLGLELVTVSRVIDGDTVELSDGRKVRLVGVNTPESTTRTEEYGEEASNYTKSKLEGRQVYLQRDVSDTDRYNRYLRLIWLEVPTDLDDEQEIRTKMFNADLVINGYAEPSTYPPDVRYSEYFRQFAREARAAGTGLWAYGENGTTKGDLDSETEESKNSSTESNTPETQNPSTSTDIGQKESFKNCTELRKKYPTGVPEGHPAYDSKHDRDKDGYACEV